MLKYYNNMLNKKKSKVKRSGSQIIGRVTQNELIAERLK